MSPRFAAATSLLCLSVAAGAQVPGGAFRLQGAPVQGAFTRRRVAARRSRELGDELGKSTP